MRRILDIITLNAVGNNEDLKEMLKNKYSLGATVKPKQEPVRFDKSLYGLQTKNIKRDVMTLFKEFKKNDYNSVIFNGEEKSLSYGYLNMTKALSVYSVLCPIQISKYITDILLEINGIIFNENIDKVIVDVSSSGKVLKDKRSKLYNELKDEIYNLYKEVGFVIE